MTLLAALDDFRAITLAAIPGLLKKLEYVAGLKLPDGRYAHWGLSRVHGERAAQRALAETHTDLASEILRTPLRRLVADAEVCSSGEVGSGSYLKELDQRRSSLLPDRAEVSSTRHFSSVLHALSALVKCQQHATHPDA